MTEADIELAREAERLRTDQPFAEAVTEIRKRALEALAVIDPIDTVSVMRLQAEVRAIDALCGQIATQILRGTPQRGKQPVA